MIKVKNISDIPVVKHYLHDDFYLVHYEVKEGIQTYQLRHMEIDIQISVKNSETKIYPRSNLFHLTEQKGISYFCAETYEQDPYDGDVEQTSCYVWGKDSNESITLESITLNEENEAYQEQARQEQEAQAQAQNEFPF